METPYRSVVIWSKKFSNIDEHVLTNPDGNIFILNNDLIEIEGYEDEVRCINVRHIIYETIKHHEYFMCYNVRATGSVSLWIDTGFPRERNEKCTNRIGTRVDRYGSVPGFSSIRSTSYFATDRSENRIDPVRSHVNGTLYLVQF